MTHLSKTTDPEKHGINLVLTPEARARLEGKRITMQRKESSLEEWLRQATAGTGAIVKVEDYAVLVATPLEPQIRILPRRSAAP